jgi:hypothetical protein
MLAPRAWWRPAFPVAPHELAAGGHDGLVDTGLDQPFIALVGESVAECEEKQVRPRRAELGGGAQEIQIPAWRQAISEEARQFSGPRFRKQGE